MSQAANVRSYHNTHSVYSLPNDELEYKRLEEQSNAINQMMGNKPFHAPITHPTAIVDIGCGTGSMTVRLAQEHEQSQVYGIDISPIPLIHVHPQNVEYIIGNFDEIVGQDKRLYANSTDFVFSRMMVVAVTDWPKYIQSCFSLLKPGGWCELQDFNYRFFDMHGHEVDQEWRWLKRLYAAAETKGLDLLCGFNFKRHMQKAGFEAIHEKEYRWTMSEQHWPEYPDSDRIGVYSVHQLRPCLAEMLRKMCEQSGQVQDADGIKSLQQHLMDTTLMAKGGHIRYSVVWGRKPAA